MEPEFARRASRRTSGDPEPGEGDFTRYAVEVTNLVHRATTEQVQELFRRLVGLCSVSYTPRSGKATVELSSRSNADTAVRLISTMRELAYSHGLYDFDHRFVRLRSHGRSTTSIT